jgi:molybdate transport system substrate-binding protein
MPCKFNFGRVLIAAILLLCTAVEVSANKKQIRVAAAADLQAAMPEIAKAFESQNDVRIDVVYGSSGNFYAQIQNGAPIDLFFSADSEYPKRLEAAGFADANASVVYGLGKIVLWMPANAACDLTRQGWNCLLDASVKKIAIANPEHAPYGRAAEAALRKAGVYDLAKTKLVLGENISQAAQFVQSGNAQAGIIAYSLAISPAMRDGKRWEIAQEMYPSIEQTMVVLKTAKEKSAAQEFVKFVTQGPGKAILLQFGFQPPPEK